MLKARMDVTPTVAVAPVNPRLFGSFVEHMGRCVYTGIYEPGHPTADADGFRTDVLELVRELGITAIRYPGGNFVSGYRWEDGIGPHEDRPTRVELAWHSIETNEFGIDEFMRWCRAANVEPIMAVNLGTRGVAEAIDLVEYVNHPGGTTLSELRRANGADAPYDVRMWCLGNEMDGPWQIGHKSATEYGKLAAQTARAMKMYDPTLELVVCGSSLSTMPTFGAWEAEVLEQTYEQVEFISCHAYYEPYGTDVDSFLATGVDMDHFIESVVATADAVRARHRFKKKINITFDEWNVWKVVGKRAPGPPTAWETAPAISEEIYDVTDAVVVGSMLISLLKHADRVTAACMSLLANVSAPIRTDAGGPAWRQSIFHPFALTARHAQGNVVASRVTAPMHFTERYGEVSTIDAVTTSRDAETCVFVVNRSQTEPVTLMITGAPPGGEVVAESLYDDDRLAFNSAEEPDRVQPVTLECEIAGDEVHVVLPPCSWSVIRIPIPVAT